MSTESEVPAEPQSFADPGQASNDAVQPADGLDPGEAAWTRLSDRADRPDHFGTLTRNLTAHWRVEQR